jgi:transposase
LRKIAAFNYYEATARYSSCEHETRMTKERRRIGDGYRIDIPASECDLDAFTGLPGKVHDRRGMRKGRLVAQEFVGFQLGKTSILKKAIWLCLCDCGNTICTAISPSVNVFSCGCLHREMNTTHGASKSREGVNPLEHQVYLAWQSQLRHCYSPNSQSYPTVGGRGIKMCDRWVKGFPAFLEDVGLPPTPGHVLARFDYDKDYEPSNVRWIPKAEHDKRAIAHSLKHKYKDKPSPSDDQILLLAQQYPDATLEEYRELLANTTGRQISSSHLSVRMKKLGLSHKEPSPSDDQILLLIQQYPDATVKEYCELLANTTGMRISRTNMTCRMQKLGISRKGRKTSDEQLMILAQRYPDATFKEYCELLAQETGIQVDQSTMSTTMRKLGIARRGQRLSDDQFILFVKKYPDASSREYCKLLAKETGLRIGRSTILNRLHQLGLAHKEQRYAFFKL